MILLSMQIQVKKSLAVIPKVPASCAVLCWFMWKLFRKWSIKLSYLTSAYMLLHCYVRKKEIICYHLWIMSQHFGGSIYFLYDWMKSCGEDKRNPPLEMPFTSIHLCKYLKATSFVTFALVPQPESSLSSSLSVSFSQDRP